jgi:hypothetical protein
VKINEWFERSLLVINYENTCFTQFRNKNSKSLDIQVEYSNRRIPSTSDISFLGIKIDKFLTWGMHIEVLINKLNKSCFAIRSLKSILSLDTLKMMYFSYVHSIITYGIIFWGNSPYIIKIFRMQKRIIMIITKSTKRAPCRTLFKELNILPLQTQYILSMSMFVIANKELFTLNSRVHNSSRTIYDLHYAQTNLAQFQKGICHMVIKIFNHLPTNIESRSNDLRSFKVQLTIFLLQNSFYTSDEFFYK